MVRNKEADHALLTIPERITEQTLEQAHSERVPLHERFLFLLLRYVPASRYKSTCMHFRSFRESHRTSTV